MTLFCQCSRETGKALRGRFIQKLTEKSIAIQNMRGQGCDMTAKDDNGSNELEDLNNRKYILLVFYNCPDKYVSLVVMLA